MKKIMIALVALCLAFNPLILEARGGGGHGGGGHGGGGHGGGFHGGGHGGYGHGGYRHGGYGYGGYGYGGYGAGLATGAILAAEYGDDYPYYDGYVEAPEYIEEEPVREIIYE